ncbi:MAG: hypothetical protein LBG65_05885 [Puniceicoccales bacterium]|nr:hypothetical protein [Puniceicoccales bacterium]
MNLSESQLEQHFIEKLRELKYTLRPEIRDRASLEKNFREKFEALNRVSLAEVEFARLLGDLVSPDVFKPSFCLREKNDFTRDDDTPLSCTLVNIRDAEAGVSLPDLAIKRYEEVRSFHESIIRNRRDYLSAELDAAKQCIAEREREKEQLDQRRAEVMNLLKSHGALEQFSKLRLKPPARKPKLNPCDSVLPPPSNWKESKTNSISSALVSRCVSGGTLPNERNGSLKRSLPSRKRPNVFTSPQAA